MSTAASMLYSPFVQPRALRIAGPVMAPTPFQQPQQLARAPSRPAGPAGGHRIAMPNSPRMEVTSYRPVQLSCSASVAGRNPQQCQHAASASDVVRLPSSPQGSPLTQYRKTRTRLSEPPQAPLCEKREIATSRWMPSTPQTGYRASPPIQFRTVPVQPHPPHGVENSPQTQFRPVHSTDPGLGVPAAVVCSPVQRPRMIGAVQSSTAAQLQSCAVQQQQQQQYRERQRAVSRVVRSTSKGRGIANGAYSSSAQVVGPLASPISYQGRPLRVVGPALVPADRSQGQEIRRRAPVSVDDLAIQKTAAMLPPSPCNTLPDFLEGVVSGDIKPAMCHSELRIDSQRYWETRRVQNSLRRVLETLQERFSPDENASSAELGVLAHDEIVLWASRANGSKHSGFLDEETFHHGMDALEAWPPELTPSDRSEVFAALRAPTIAVVRGLSTGGQLEKELSRRRFGEGFARVPFNLPDFPVPTHLLQIPGVARGANEVAAVIASSFCLPGGLESVNDFFLCGLLSFEEIQITLPFLAPASIVEEAITKIIRAGTEHFTPREWQDFVISVRLAPPEPEAAQETPTNEPPAHPVQQTQNDQLPISLASPEPQHREVPFARPVLGGENKNQAIFWRDPMGFTSEIEASQVSELPRAEESVQRERKLTPRTEPLPTREVRNEAPVQFQLGHHVINWNATRRAAESQSNNGTNAGVPVTSPADNVSAGIETESGQEQREHRNSAVNPFTQNREAENVNDPGHWISMGMHNECSGPFLAIAFVRCCQLYDVRRSKGSLLS